MTLLKITLASLTILVYACSTAQNSIQDNNSYEGANLCKLIEQMNDKDQEKRALIQDPFFSILDSLWTANGLTFEEYQKIPREEQLEYGKKARKIANTTFQLQSPAQQDSIMNLQVQLDNENTELLIDIIEKRGFPNEKNCDCEEFPGMIFVHSQTQYWEKIKTNLYTIIFFGILMDVREDQMV